ncbi:mechanosensitive ion channel family protein [Fibrobacterota bacterium]
MDEIKEVLKTVFSWLGPNRYVQAGIISVLSIAGAKLGDFLISRVVARLASRTKTDLDDRLVQIMHRPLFVSFLLIGMAAALNRLQLPVKLDFAIMALTKTVAVMVWLVFCIQFTGLFLTALSRLPDRYKMVQARTLPLFKNLVMMVLIGGAVYFIFLSWRIDVTAWLASAGIIGIALGFAAKDTLANLFAGVFILVDAPYKLGDFIVLDSGERGEVKHIGIRSTRLLTRDDIEITIPNAIMGNTKIINETGGPHTKERIRVKVGVAYGTDIDRVRSILMEIAKANNEVCDYPEPKVRFRTFGNSSLDFELLCWVREPLLRGRVLDALNSDIYKRFNTETIEIPYPKQDVYIKDMPGS